MRSYPYGRLAAHVLGWTGLIDAEQYAELQKQGYGPNDIVGKAGLEATYEQYLRGERGKQKLIVNCGRGDDPGARHDRAHARR